MTNTVPPSSDRYARQARFAEIGEAGQQRISQSRVLVCGCGALGSVIANTLVRAGVGFVRIVDRDFLELNNLQRQVLYDESDVRSGLPKAIAAQRRLQQINQEVEIDAHVADVNHKTIGRLVEDVDILVDGTDNFETRFLLNDAAHQYAKPWVYGGCLGAEGQTMTILPGETPCFRCLVSDPPPAGSMPTCDSAGVIGPIINIVASFQAAEALKLASGNRDSINRALVVVDVWQNQIRRVDLQGLDQAACPACSNKEYPWLAGQAVSQTAVLCGRNAVQLAPAGSEAPALDQIAEQLSEFSPVTRNPYLIRAEVDGYQITLFADGRAVIGGTDDPVQARTVYARYIGH